MKKFIALFISALLLFLCACDNEKPNNDYVSYVNVDDYTGIARETKADWFETEPDASGAVTEKSAITADELPDGFPSIPEGTSNISMIKYSKSESKAGYRSDWIEVKFSAPKHSIMKFSSDLIAAGYKGGIKFVESEDGVYEYYGRGWHGGWQNGKHIISVVGSQDEIDGSFALTLHITECGESFYPELVKLFPAFEWQSLTRGKYYEVPGNGRNNIKHDFDGSFHEKWEILYAYEEALIGVTRAEFESYIKKLKTAGFEGETFNYRLDGCSTLIYDGINTERNLYISMVFNENLQSVNVVFTNDGTSFGISG